MYNVALNKEQLQTGREFVRAYILNLRKIDSMPAGSASGLQLLFAQSESNWNKFQSCWNRDIGWMNVASLLVTAVTHATVASELVAEMRWVQRMLYHPLAGEVMTDEQLHFANTANALMRLMKTMVETLSEKPKTTGGERESVNSPETLLNYALHVTELALTMCRDKNYSYEHPDTSKWLKARSRVKRNFAAGLIESARLDEAAAGK